MRNIKCKIFGHIWTYDRICEKNPYFYYTKCKRCGLEFRVPDGIRLK
jgi:hypothetical protein